jgi:hypothetical protein
MSLTRHLIARSGMRPAGLRPWLCGRNAVLFTPLQRRSRSWRAWVMGLLLAAACVTAQAGRVALLVGIGAYPQQDNRLDGPANDVQALRDVLVRRWGYRAADVVTLVDAAATRAAILQALRDLQQRSAPGDEVLIYFSGHGTSGLDSAMRLSALHGSGALVPVDVDLRTTDRILDTVLVGRRDLRPLIDALDRGRRRLWVVADTCYSGQLVRNSRLSDGALLPGRYFTLPRSVEGELLRDENARRAKGRPAIDPYPYVNTAYLSAAAEGEVARDIPAGFLRLMPTLDGKPHGAMTDALLRVLEGQLPADFDRNGLMDLHEVHRAVSDFMASRGYGHTPQRLPAVLEDAQGLGQRPLLGLRGQVAATVAGAEQPLRVRLLGLGAPWQPAVAAVRGVMQVEGRPFDLQIQPAKAAKAVETVDLVTAAGDRITTLDAPHQLRGQLAQLALGHALRQLADRHRRGVLPVEVSPSDLGGNFREGDAIEVTVRPDRDAWALALALDSGGHVSVLYPNAPHELKAVRGGQPRSLTGGQPITVEKPYGMDVLLVFAFDARPPALDRWMNAQRMPPDDARVDALLRLLPEMSGRFTFAPTELRTLEPLK